MRFFVTLLMLMPIVLQAQVSLPDEVRLTDDGRLTYGGNETEGFYKIDEVNKLELTLTQANWFQLMDGSGGPGGSAGESLIGTLTYNDTLVLDSVLIGIKGQTSDFQNTSEKKSFNIKIDELKDQDLLGYDNLNLNCAFQDQSSMREVLYYDISKHFAPALKGNFVDLYINGQYWGPYNNIQQIEGQYIKEWFTDNDGTRWRAERTSGSGPGGGGFGAGVSTLNYNGPDSTDYNTSYTLKKTGKENPWEDLIEACDYLNNTPIAALPDELKYYLDIDRALWFLAQEIVFSDDDSYINKGGMDYYVYWDHATDRIIPMEVDGNSVMTSNHVSWSPFYNENDTDFPLLNRLLQNGELRQRYLAHLRTVLGQHFVEQEVHDRIDEFAALLDQRVQDDPKKIYSYTQFVNGVNGLKGFVSNRIDYLSSNAEINRQGVQLANPEMESPAGAGMAPQAGEEVQIRVEALGNLQKVVLYYGLGLDGVFERVEMFDDGTNGDLAAGDNIFGASIPGFASGNYVRYYMEAVKDDAWGTATYLPAGAEHDVFVYRVEQTLVAGAVTINELMASNESRNADGSGEYDDWVELYNTGATAVDLTGYHLSDDEGDIAKWQFPDGTTIEADGYLIVWADEDDNQSSPDELHANFKLSASGETVVLSNAAAEITDLVTFGEQQTDLAFARIPNGTGSFVVQAETFAANNEGATGLPNETEVADFAVYPNPAGDRLNIRLQTAAADESLAVVLANTSGQLVVSGYALAKQNPQIGLDVSQLPGGVYFVLLKNHGGAVLASRRVVVVR